MKKWMSLLLCLVLVLGIVPVAAAEESDPIGVVEKNVYTNQFFGFRVQLPDNWRFLSDADLASWMGYDSAYGSREGLAALLEKEFAACAMYAAANDSPFNMNFMVTDLREYKDLTEADYLGLVKDGLVQTLQMQGYTNVVLTERAFTVSGKDLTGASVTGSLGNFAMHMGIVLFKEDRYMGTLTVAASSEDQLNECLGFLTLLDEYGFAPIEATLPSLSSAEMSTVSMPDIGTTEEASQDRWTVIGSILDTAWGKDFPMVEASSGCWVSAPLPMKAGDEFKVRMNGDWAVNRGIADGVCVQDGGNVKVEQDGTYIVTLDLVNETLTFAERTEDAWGVIGSICGTSWDTDFPMAETEPGIWRSMPLELMAKDEFKVRLNASWENVDYGEGCTPYGTNIIVPEDGVYTVTLDLNAMTLTFADAAGAQPEEMADEADSWSVIGTIKGTNWDTDFPMREILPGVWMSDMMQLKAGEEFKVRKNGSWAVNYGITDGACVQDGQNVKIEKDGFYTITLDLNMNRLTW